MSVAAERAQRQEEKAKELRAAAVKSLASLTINTSRSLGDARRDPSANLTVEHTESVDRALQGTDLSDVAVGQFDKNYIHQRLGLELHASDLVVSSEPPKYEKLRQVLDTLDELLEERGVFGEYRELVQRKKGELLEVEAKFRDSQVNIDEMDHDGFHTSVETLKQVVLTSVESIVEKMNADMEDIVVKYQTVLKRQLDAFDAESSVVESASPARMRASRAEDDEDPWQTPAAALEVNYASTVLQQYIESEKALKVAEVYEQEWTQERRRDVSRLLPRAERVVAEQDADLCEEADDSLQRLADISDAKVFKIKTTMRDSDEESARILGDLQSSIQSIQAAGDAYQARKRQQRLASERDLERLEQFVAQETKHDVHCREEYAEKQVRGSEWLKENDTLIADKVKQVIALQEEIVRLAASRQAVSEDLVERVEEEQRRRSEHAEVLEQCAAYTEMLHVSMRNFLLPEGYSSVLADFAQSCETLAKERFDSHSETLSRLLHSATNEANSTRSTAFVAPRLRIFRYKKRVEDLMEKAGLARAMRDFCASTLDPYLPQHEHTEAQLLELARTIEARIPPLQKASDEHRQKYEAILPVLQECNISPAFSDLDNLFMQVLDEDEQFVVRGSRPPLITLVMPETKRADEPRENDDKAENEAPAATAPEANNALAVERPSSRSVSMADTNRDPLPHLVVPRAYYAIDMVDRANKAHNVVKQFV